jgi:threonyl-tRNA synthetase
MAHPVASTSQPAQLPALDAPHADTNKKPKEAKEKKAKPQEGLTHPLEVCISHVMTGSDCDNIYGDSH